MKQEEMIILWSRVFFFLSSTNVNLVPMNCFSIWQQRRHQGRTWYWKVYDVTSIQRRWRI